MLMDETLELPTPYVATKKSLELVLSQETLSYGERQGRIDFGASHIGGRYRLLLREAEEPPQTHHQAGNAQIRSRGEETCVVHGSKDEVMTVCYFVPDPDSLLLSVERKWLPLALTGNMAKLEFSCFRMASELGNLGYHQLGVICFLKVNRAHFEFAALIKSEASLIHAFLWLTSSLSLSRLNVCWELLCLTLSL